VRRRLVSFLGPQIDSIFTKAKCSAAAVSPTCCTWATQVGDTAAPLGLGGVRGEGRPEKAEKGDQYYILDLIKGMYLVQLLDKNKRILTTQKMEKR